MIGCEMEDAVFAGLFAGEGTVGIYKNAGGFYGVRIAMQMTDLPLIASVQRRFGGRVTKHTIYTKGGRKQRTMWNWETNGSKREVLEVLSRYCTGDKAPQIALVIQYFDEFGEWAKMGPPLRRTKEQKQRQEWYRLEVHRLKTIEYEELANVA